MSALRRLWALPLGVHAVALTVLLLGLLPLTRPGMAYMSDEGIVILQSRLVDQTGSWILPEPLASLDPEGRARVFPGASIGTKGRAPYIKHPLYPVLLMGAEQLAGTVGLWLPGVAGTVLAALVGAWLGRDVRPGIERVTLWLLGLASPLLFYAYTVQGHSIGAAGAGLATLGAVRAVRSPGLGPVVAVATGIALSASLRSEATIFAVALAVAAVVVARWSARPLLPGALSVSLAAVAAVVLVRTVESRFARRVIGTGLQQAVPAASGGGGSFLADRVEALRLTWFTPSYVGGLSDIALLAAMLAIAAAAVFLRLGAGWRVVRGVLAVAPAGYLVWLLAWPPHAIPGLAIAAPVLWAGLWLVRRASLDAVAGRVAAVTGVLFTGGVLLTQYRIGGGVEWGGRFFVLALPVAGPVLIAGLAGWLPPRRTADRGAPRLAAGLVLLSAAVLAIGAVGTLATTHDRARQVLERVAAAAKSAPPGNAPGGDDRPIVLTAERLLPALLWPDYDEYRWLVPERARLGEYAARLHRAGVERVIFVSADPTSQLPMVKAEFPGTDDYTGRGSRVSVLVLASEAS